MSSKNKESKEFIRNKFFEAIEIPNDLIQKGYENSIEAIHKKWCNCENKHKGQSCPEHN